jgi:uncharacterized protein
LNGTLAVAALSARLMAESARRGGYRVAAMDVFGDVDTRHAAVTWTRIGEPATMRLDAERTIGALQAFAREAGALGWVAGSGFEAMPDILDAGARISPLIGNAPSVVASVRDPPGFFARLDALGIPHPETSVAAPASANDWLVKDARGSGAWHIRAARPEDLQRGDVAEGTYFQRRTGGRALGALFIANRRRARIVGVSEQTIRARHGHPYVYCGIVGPVSLPPAVAARIEEAVSAVVEDMGLAGLNSLDLLLEGDEFYVLEVNARPSSSIALYDSAYERGLMHAHVEAVREGILPAAPGSTTQALRGNEIVFADRLCRATPDLVALLVDSGWCHDLPQPSTRFTPGEPLCSVSAQAHSMDELHALLDERRKRVTAWIEATDG